MSVGDTNFHRNAGPHTITQFSALEVYNKSSASGAFATSGQQEAGFNYNLVINDTKPIWLYCGVKTHCEMSMFGDINISQANPNMQSSSSTAYVPLCSVVSKMTSMSSDMMAAYHYTKMQTSNNTYTNNWGIDIFSTIASTPAGSDAAATGSDAATPSASSGAPAASGASTADNNKTNGVISITSPAPHLGLSLSLHLL
ncbi:hypothetical protein M422DRAFT_43087 [Sphaerobolus stellatus SS14]|nr:hypothetical protein M422DRAFT_43087 [Sphaerobolus stellatus SS14]